jgi:protein-disulfide isomerase
LSPQIEQLLEKYPTNVKLVHKNFPIRSHKFAFKAAIAALAADRQGKFWEFHDELYKNYNRLSEQKITEIAKQLGLNEADFEKLQNDSAIITQIRRDYEEGIQLGIRGVPTVFINGRKISDRSMQNMEAVINKELAKVKEPGSNATENNVE